MYLKALHHRKKTYGDGKLEFNSRRKWSLLDFKDSQTTAYMKHVATISVLIGENAAAFWIPVNSNS